MADDAVKVRRSELRVRRGPLPAMPRPHRHDDVEVNLVVDGMMEYRFGADLVTVAAGEIALFWAARPHLLVNGERHGGGDICWVHVPLSTLLGWQLPDRQLSEVLLSGPVIVAQEAVGRNVVSMFESWQSDLTDPETAQIALLETQALLRRILHHHVLSAAERRPTRPPTEAMGGVTAMVRFVIDNFQESISITDIAAAAHLHPNYATTIFRQTVGTTLGAYLTRCRVDEARRFLTTTTMPISQVTHAAGFGSQSSFYDHFTRICGMSPGAFRDAQR